jgi:predicted esterase
MQIHHLPVQKTARYATIGNSTDPSEIWFVFHGYRQLAPRFLSYFQHLDDGRRLIVAPEGLSRFYVDTGYQKVGASWMTKEDREIDIQDYLQFLNQMAADVMRDLDRSRVECTILGFSQGVATAVRWAIDGDIPPDRVIVWGDQLPHDYETADSVQILRDSELFVVRGLEDEYINDEVAEVHQENIRKLDLSFDYLTFPGGHRLDKDTLALIAGQSK